MYLKQNTSGTMIITGIRTTVRSALDGTTPIPADETTSDLEVYIAKNGVFTELTDVGEGGDNELTIPVRGCFALKYTADETDTPGRLEALIQNKENELKIISVSKEFMVMAAGVYESMFGGSTLSSKVIPAGYVDNFKEDDDIYFMWQTNGTAAGDGIIKIYKEDDSDPVYGTVLGAVYDSRDFFGTGTHLCKISARMKDWYEKEKDYIAVVEDETIDGQKTKAIIAAFSIQKRYVGRPMFIPS